MFRAEALSALIRRNVECGVLHVLRIFRQAPIVLSFFFIDDTIVFGRASVAELGRVREILASYEAASWLAINLSKSKIMCSGGLPSDVRIALAGLIGVWCAEQHAIYLGIPINVGRSRSVIFRTLASRIENKLKDWKSKLLSQVEKLVLLKYFAQAIPHT